MRYRNTQAIERAPRDQPLATHLSRLVAGLVVVVLAAACRTVDDSWSRVAEAGVLRVGLDPTFEPFEVAAGDGPIGIDVDLAKAIGDQLGLEVNYAYFGYDGLYDALATGQVDLLLSALVVAPERMEDFAYTSAYFDAGQALFVPAGSDVSGMAGLNGRRLAVELGTLGHVEAQAWQRRLSELTVTAYPSVDAALATVLDGVADAALVDHVSGRLYANQGSRPAALLRVPEVVAPEPYAIVLRIDDEALYQQVEGALDTVRTSGQLEEIIIRWLGP